MNFKEFRTLSRKSTNAALSRIRNHRHNKVRPNSPYRGVWFKHFFGKDAKAYAFYQELCNYIFNYIENSDLPISQKESLLIWEKFQSQQKGPAAPINNDTYDDVILGDIDVQAFDIPSGERELLEQVFDDLCDYLQSKVSLDVLSLDPSSEWSKLPNGTVRGFPFCGKGSENDEEIISLGGKDVYSALRYMKSTDDFICFPGYRVQGKPFPGPAKLRLIFIPPVHSQYLDNALVNLSQSQLKSLPCFAGWQNPIDRYNTFSEAESRALKSDITRIQLDYSKYDKHIHPFFQRLVSKYFERVTTSGRDVIKQRNEQFSKFRDNQFVILPNKRDIPSFYSVPYQLASGEKRTQHDGSLIGLTLMGYLWIKIFDKKIPWELTAQLGDDAVFPVPNSYLENMGYQGLLKEISKVLEAIGFHLNPTKAYPNTDLAFLQRLWVKDLGLMDIGSWTRNLASFIWMENFKNPIKGVRMWALERLSQIDILSEPYSFSTRYDIHGVARHLVDVWLKYDRRMVMVLSYLKEKGALTPDQLFEYLVKISNASFDHILDYFEVKSYDHKGLSEKLQSPDRAKAFPILEVLCSTQNLPSFSASEYSALQLDEVKTVGGNTEEDEDLYTEGS